MLARPPNLRGSFSAEASKDPIAGSKGVFNKMATRANANLFVDFLAEASRNADFQRTLRENIREFTSVLEDYPDGEQRTAGKSLSGPADP